MYPHYSSLMLELNTKREPGKVLDLVYFLNIFFLYLLIMMSKYFPTLASQEAGTTCLCHHTWLKHKHIIFENDYV